MRRMGTFLALAAGALLTFGAPAPAAAQDDGNGGATELKVDPAHSNFLARVKHLGVAYYYSQFQDVSGTIKLNKEKTSESSVNITVKAESFESNHEKRNKHIKGPDFLNAKKYPEITFESKKVEKKDEKTWEVTGDFTLRGQTKEITIDVKHLGSTKGPEGKTHHGFYTVFDINRLDWGIDWKPDAGVVSEDVQLTISIEAVTG